MKYILICVVALVGCFGLGFVIAKLINKKNKLLIVLSTISLGLILMIGGTLVYMSIYYHADNDAKNSLSSNVNVSVSKIDCGYFFDGNGTENALIFYSGAKVECEAYAPLMQSIALQGIDCFLIDMPFNFAIFGSNYADKIINNYSYNHFIMSGHSLGGLMASQYTANNTNKVFGLVLFASYSTKKIDESVKVLSIYGSLDGCLNIEEYEKNFSNLPANTKEVIIDGGNHSQFGNYGNQKYDGNATITYTNQQQVTALAIADFFIDD